MPLPSAMEANSPEAQKLAAEKAKVEAEKKSVQADIEAEKKKQKDDIKK